jgi:hypothetical protein
MPSNPLDGKSGLWLFRREERESGLTAVVVASARSEIARRPAEGERHAVVSSDTPLTY